jgi:hypothetical protein
MTRRSFVANASLSRTRYRYANAITFCDGDLAQSAVLGSPQEEQLCKTDPDTKRAACLAGDLNPQSSLMPNTTLLFLGCALSESMP